MGREPAWPPEPTVELVQVTTPQVGPPLVPAALVSKVTLDLDWTLLDAAGTLNAEAGKAVADECAAG